MMLLLLLTGCRTSQSEELYVPQLNVEVEKPTLYTIPKLDLSGYTLEQQTAITGVLATYNENLIKLIDYANRLVEMQDVILDYYTEIIKVSN